MENSKQRGTPRQNIEEIETQRKEVETWSLACGV